MGREAKVVRPRECDICERLFYMSGPDMIEHVDLCRRVQELGIIVPGGIIEPEIVLTDNYDNE